MTGRTGENKYQCSQDISFGVTSGNGQILILSRNWFFLSGSYEMVALAAQRLSYQRMASAEEWAYLAAVSVFSIGHSVSSHDSLPDLWLLPSHMLPLCWNFQISTRIPSLSLF